MVRFLEEQRAQDFSYTAVGATRDNQLPAGFNHDHNRQRLGAGAPTFAVACKALCRWAMFPSPFARIEPWQVPIVPGEMVGVLVRALGLWWYNAARLVYVIDEPRRFGFAYGTLPGHVERGEERFLVERLDDDSVWYDLVAFSQPNYWMARHMKPIVRHLQRRFAKRSKAAMLRAVTQALVSSRSYERPERG